MWLKIFCYLQEEPCNIQENFLKQLRGSQHILALPGRKIRRISYWHGNILMNAILQ